MALVGRPRWTLAVPTDGSAELVPLRLLLLPFGKPGGFQVQVPLQSPTGGGANGAGVVEPGQLGAFGRDEIAAQLPLGQGCSRGIGIGIHAGTGGPERACRLARTRSITSSGAAPLSASSSR